MVLVALHFSSMSTGVRTVLYWYVVDNILIWKMRDYSREITPRNCMSARKEEICQQAEHSARPQRK